MAQSPAPGAALFTPKGEAAETGARSSGFRSFAGQFMCMDIAERLVRLAHEKMEKGEAFTPEDPQTVSLGLSGQGFAQLMRGAGFRPAVSQGPSDANWALCGRPHRDRGRVADLNHVTTTQLVCRLLLEQTKTK